MCHRIQILIFLALFCPNVVAQKVSSSYSLQIRELQREGDSLVDLEQWGFAIEKFQMAISQGLQSDKDFTEIMRLNLKLADAQRMEGEFESASESYFQALQGFKATGAVEDLPITYKKISIHLSSTDPLRAIAYADTAYQHVAQNFEDDTTKRISYLFEYADRHRTAVLYREAIDQYLQVLDLIRKTHTRDTLTWFNTLRRLGGVLSRLDRREESLEHYKQAEQLLLEKYAHDELLLRNFYQDLSFLLEDMGDFEEALNYRKRYCEYFFARGDSSSFSVSRAMNDLGVMYERRGEYEEANHWYQKVLANNRRIYGPTSIYTAFPLNNVGNIYKHLGRPEEGLPLLQQALKIFEDYLGNDHIFPANVRSNIGDAYQQMGLPEEALPYNEAALQIRRKKLAPYHEDLARDYRLLGDIYAAIHDFTMAVIYYDSSAIATKFDPGIGLESVISHSRLYQALSQKALLYRKWFDETDDLKTLAKCLETYSTIDHLTDYVRSSYRSEGSKRYLLNNRRNTYEQAVASHLSYYDRTEERSDFDEAFRFSEKIRSLLLYEALLASQAEHFGMVPLDMINELAELQQQISELEKALFQLKNAPENESEKNSENSKNRLFQVQQDYRRLLEEVGRDYPAYFELKYKMETLSTTDLQAKLSENQIFLEYLIADGKVFVFVIGNDSYSFERIDLDFPLRQWIMDLRTGIYGYALSRSQSQELYDSMLSIYTDRAKKLYEKLIKPLENELTGKSTLLIAADQALYYLPFEVLLSLPEEGTNFKEYSYLIRDFDIQYVPSATLWEEMESRDHKSRNSQVLAFAPSFDGETDYTSIETIRSGLGRLEYNDREISSIAQIFSVNSYVGEEATKTTFLERASDHSMLHLATHGKANDLLGDYSFLAFYGNSDASEGSRLYASEIYNLDLSAQMVVLSACETGIGELQEGEGIIGLARAFSYAGARSLITTLWGVNDQATSLLMSSFYQQLKSGKTKAASLREAKLQYIKDVMNPIEAHPFYWAGIISMGDIRPLTDFGISDLILVWLGVLLGAILILGFFGLNRRRRS